ncbi:MAG: Vms1/Ankzf1 family peptidyl-tRNA hydrolase [Halobacteria archaeon]|nr:Vms1/Ankzf1 family peptidyl-tRNA hydrolase [Halobacteria archaeon]
MPHSTSGGGTVERGDGFRVRARPDGETDRVAVSHHSSNVKSKHSKGGFSQSRFERLREEQVEEHIDESVEEFEEMLENSETEAEFTVVCGESNVVERFSDRLGTELRVETRAVDARGEKEELLRAGFERFWRTRLHVF